MSDILCSFHSHSGEFCRHAKDTLGGMVLNAVKKGFTHYGLSEHMPRYRDQDLYPEEREAEMTPAHLEQVFADYVRTARGLQEQHKDTIQLLVGFESEFCRPESLADCQALMQAHALDYMIGSVHHVKQIPIDFDEACTLRAEQACGGAEGLFLAYFEAVEQMIHELKPDIVGHFDLIRLKRPSFELTAAVVKAAEKAMDAGIAADCIFEVNSAGLRKGLQGPYPHSDMLQMMVSKGAKLTIGDDAHCIEQIGTCYPLLAQHLRACGVETLWYLEREGGQTVRKSTATEWKMLETL